MCSSLQDKESGSDVMRAHTTVQRLASDRTLYRFERCCESLQSDLLGGVFPHQFIGATSASSTSMATERMINSTEITRRKPSFRRTRMPSSPDKGPLCTRTRRPTLKKGWGSKRAD